MTNRKNYSDNGKAAQGEIQIKAPEGPLDLYQWYPLEVTVPDPGTNWVIWLNAGPEDPLPSEGRAGHTFMFDKSDIEPDHLTGTGTINIKAVGPNVDTKVTIYAWSPAHSLVTGNVDLQFRAVENPPKSTIGILSLNGAALRWTNNQISLFRAAYMDPDGNPLQGDIEWTTDVGRLFSEETPATADGSTTNGTTLIHSGNDFAITAKAPDGAMATLRFDNFGNPSFLPGPNIIITTDETLHQLTAAHPEAPDGTEVLWEAYPDEKVKFTNRTTEVKDGKTQNTISFSGEEAFMAYISASNFNPQRVGGRDYGTLPLLLQQGGSVIVTSDEPSPLTLYEPHWLEAKFTGENEQAITEYVWSVDPLSDPDHVYRFDPNPSPRIDGKFRTQITAIGKNVGGGVMVNARSVGLDDNLPHVGWLNLSFKYLETPPTKNFIKVESVDGNPLSTGDWHMVQALCTTATGDPLKQRSVTWNPSSTSIRLLNQKPTLTDDYGIATNMVSATEAIVGTVGAYLSDDNTVIDQLGLIFETDDVTLQGEGTMTITSSLNPPFTLGAPHEFNVRYLDSSNAPMPKGTNIEWSAYPSDLLTFERPITQVEDDQGNSSNTIIGQGDNAIPAAVISTRSFNDKTKDYDHGSLTTSFQPSTEPTVALFGVLLDKAYCKNPGRNQKVDPTKSSQVIKCQVQVLGAAGPQKVSFPFNPGGLVPAAPPEIYNGKTYALLDEEDGAYYTMTDGGNPPTATVLVGCRQPVIFTLGTAWQPQDRQPAVCLTIATNSAETNVFYDAPTIQSPLVNGNLQLPPSTQWPAPTFKAFLPASSTLAPDDQIAFLINDQLVYNGPAKPALNGAAMKGPGVDLAYASLLTDGSMNNLVYVIAGYDSSVSSPLSFTASGTAQTGPIEKGLSRTQPAPWVSISSGEIGPDAIVSWLTESGLKGGLPAEINPRADVGDEITLYFYLSGTDALTGDPVNNVVPVTYNVMTGDPLTLNGTATVYLKQWAAAGYQDGTLQIDYRIRTKNGTFWSTVSPTYTLKTTF